MQYAPAIMNVRERSDLHRQETREADRDPDFIAAIADLHHLIFPPSFPGDLLAVQINCLLPIPSIDCFI